MKKIILILVGLALCLTVAAQEKAKTTNVQGYALAIDNAFYSFKESTKAITDQILGGDSICSSSSPKKQIILLWE